MQTFMRRFFLMVSIVCFVAALLVLGDYAVMQYKINQDIKTNETQAVEVLKKPIPKPKFEPKENDIIGKVTIDRFNISAPIKEGVTTSALRSSIGHEPSTSFPGDNSQIFLAGHNYQAFQVLKDTQKGDIITVEMPYGTYKYEVFDLKHVKADQVDVIKPNLDHEELILMTCYPFVTYLPTYDRYLVYAKPVKN